jgi:hypothetical protein
MRQGVFGSGGPRLRLRVRRLVTVGAWNALRRMWIEEVPRRLLHAL